MICTRARWRIARVAPPVRSPVRYAAAGGPNQVIGASAGPAWALSFRLSAVNGQPLSNVAERTVAPWSGRKSITF